MAAKIRGLPTAQFHGDNELPLALGKIYTYEPGTTTNKATYQDKDRTTAHANPIVLDAEGRAEIWWNGTYDVIIKDASDNTIDSVDNYGANESSSVSDSGKILNPSFEYGDTEPDDWTLTADSGQSPLLESTDVNHGASALKFTSTGSGGGTATSVFYEVFPGQEEIVSFQLKSSVVGVRNLVEVLYFDKAQSSVSNDTVYDDSTTNPTSWATKVGMVTAPATAVYAKIKIHGCHNSDATAGNSIFDGFTHETLNADGPRTKGSDIISALALDVNLTGDFHDITATAVPITAASAANPVVITATAHALTNGDIITISGVAGFTSLNGNTYTVANAATNTFELSGIDKTIAITGATQANPVVITAPGHGLANASSVDIASVGGMIELNGNTYTVANKTTDTFELSGINGTGYAAYTSGGLITTSNLYTSGGEIAINVTSLSAFRVGAIKKLQSDTSFSLMYHATNLLTPGDVDLKVVAGDVVELVEYASGDWKVTNVIHKPAVVSGYVQGKWTSIESDVGADATSLDVETEIAVDTWESVGPTGSGADNTWTALDDVPASATSILVKVRIFANNLESNNYNFKKLYCRHGDSSTGASALSQVAEAGFIHRMGSGNGTWGDANVVQFYIPINAGNVFGCHWTYFTSNDTGSITAYLVGWLER